MMGKDNPYRGKLIAKAAKALTRSIVNSTISPNDFSKRMKALSKNIKQQQLNSIQGRGVNMTIVDDPIVDPFRDLRNLQDQRELANEYNLRRAAMLQQPPLFTTSVANASDKTPPLTKKSLDNMARALREAGIFKWPSPPAKPELSIPKKDIVQNKELSDKIINKKRKLDLS